MFCIIVRGKDGSKSWRGWRSAEILGYHDDEEKVQILFFLYLENLLGDGKDNWLEILHPGNTQCHLHREPWPLRSHPDEPRTRGAEKNILRSLYANAFAQDKDGQLRHVNGLTAWDSWYIDSQERPVSPWPACQGPDSGSMKRSFPREETDVFVPYTVFELGPFRTAGLVLLAFQLSFAGDTYRKLVKESSVFTVDGPETLLLRIMRKYIPHMTDQAQWLERLGQFEDYVGVGESYDVILLQNPPCESIRPIGRSGIIKAPLQPHHRQIAQRYITANRRFCLSLQYEKDAQRLRKSKTVGTGQ